MSAIVRAAFRLSTLPTVAVAPVLKAEVTNVTDRQATLAEFKFNEGGNNESCCLWRDW